MTAGHEEDDTMKQKKKTPKRRVLELIMTRQYTLYDDGSFIQTGISTKEIAYSRPKEQLKAFVKIKQKEWDDEGQSLRAEAPERGDDG